MGSGDAASEALPTAIGTAPSGAHTDDGLTIRPATDADLPAICLIYNHWVRTCPATFDTEPFTVEQRRPWFEKYAETGPYRLLIAEQEGAIVGYATSSRFRERPAYRTSVEVSAYCAHEARGRGVGTKLYGALLPILEQNPGLHRAYAGVTLPNPASCRLHERLGFEKIGHYREVGFKFDRYWDVAWFERAL